MAKGAAISAVNLAEVYAKIVSEWLSLDQVSPRFKALGLIIVPFGKDEARISSELYPVCRSLGLPRGVKQIYDWLKARKSKINKDLEETAPPWMKLAILAHQYM